MLRILRTGQFKKDLKRGAKQHRNLDELKRVLEKLQRNEPLEPRHRDHQLSQNWKGFRDCHIEPDWVFIYQIIEDELRLVRIGSHSELFRK
jgi:mRNA interferase YafQ